MEFDKVYQSADWKTEKHSPVIEIVGKAVKGQPITVTAGVGKEIAHPNTTEHHIAWIQLFFLPDGEKFAVELAKAGFDAHGASAQGPNTSTIYTDPSVTVKFKTEKSGTLLASSYCNIHGLWQSELPLKV